MILINDQKVFSYNAKFVLFYLLGIGPNWVLATVLGSQIPYFENNFPEGHKIAAYCNLANSLGILLVFMYWLYTNYIGPIPHEMGVPFILLLSCFSGFLAVGIHDISTGGISFLLYLCNFLAGGVGALSSVIMNPFMSNYGNSYVL